MRPTITIATNVPFSFTPRGNVNFVNIGERSNSTDAIIVMLDKNFGSSFIETIDALTHWISTYPKEVPCYLIGCETRIPSRNIHQFQMPARDEAIKRLCNEVLSRSQSIGVRGEITQLHLRDLIGIDEYKIDIIYDAGEINETEIIRKFLKKNGIPFYIENLDWDLLVFQRNPEIVYQRPITFDQEITIFPPFVTVDGEYARLNAEVLIDGRKQILWCQTQRMYRQYLLAERADAFVCALLPLAMRSGKNIKCFTPVTEQFFHNINEILVPQLCAHDSRLHRTLIFASSDASNMPSGNAVATGLSCGVDSLYTTSMYLDSQYKSMNLTHLYTGNYIHGNDSPVYRRAQSVADELDIPLVKTETNINTTLNLPHLYTHFFKTMFGVLSLRKLFNVYYYSTAEDFSHFDLRGNGTSDTAIFELLLLYSFSCLDFQVVTGGVKSERPDKTRAIASLPLAQKHLNVCLDDREPINCGKCEKCVRTLLTIDMCGEIDNFAEVFNIAEYKSSRLRKFVYLVEQKKSPMLAEVYQYFVQSEPDLIAKAEEIFSSRFPKAADRSAMLKYL